MDTVLGRSLAKGRCPFEETEDDDLMLDSTLLDQDATADGDGRQVRHGIFTQAEGLSQLLWIECFDHLPMIWRRCRIAEVRRDSDDGPVIRLCLWAFSWSAEEAAAPLGVYPS